MLTLNYRQIGILIGTAVLLLVPLIAIQFTHEVNWSLSDFVVATGLLLGIGFAVEWTLRKVRKKFDRMMLIAGGVITFLLVWAEFAVGIFGTPFAGN